MTTQIRRIGAGNLATMRALLDMFGDVFDDYETYRNNQPSDNYLAGLLDTNQFIALAAVRDNQVVGGLAAYELLKFEQQRSEIYIYDLAVRGTDRRQGVATALINRLCEIARSRDAHIVFVQADTSAEDGPAIALYTKLGSREEVLHFDIPLDK